MKNLIEARGYIGEEESCLGKYDLHPKTWGEKCSYFIDYYLKHTVIIAALILGGIYKSIIKFPDSILFIVREFYV